MCYSKDSVSLPNLIHNNRLKMNISIEILSRKSGIIETDILDFENGNTSLGIKNVLNIINILEIPIADIMPYLIDNLCSDVNREFLNDNIKQLKNIYDEDPNLLTKLLRDVNKLTTEEICFLCTILENIICK